MTPGVRAAFRAAMLAGVASAALAPNARAQTPANTPLATAAGDAAPSANSGASGPSQTLDTVTVTGSRILRNGYAAPTPVTVVSVSQLQASIPTDISDALNKLPVFDGSQTGVAGQGGTGGANVSNVPGNYLNLRNFGINRTLILMNGLRVPPTNYNGQVDVDGIPNMLVQRVDVVTGGVSAVYGSDAVTGVVNFITDTHFNGLKGDAQTGISNSGDMASSRYELAVGGDLFNLGHVEGSAEHFQEGGLLHEQRSYGLQRTVYTGNGTAANPYRLTNNPTLFPQGPAFYKSAFGGYVATGPFAGKQFLDSGQLAPFNPGTPTGTSTVNQGGDGAYYSNLPLYAPQNINQLYGRFDRDITGSIKGFVQVSDTWATINQRFSVYAPPPLTMYGGNPFLPASAQALLAPNQPFFYNAFIRDLTLQSVQTQMNSSLSVTAGLNGKINDNYSWQLNYTHGANIFRERLTNNINVPRFLAATDAVTGPSGAPVCRVSTTANAGLYPGCVPIDIFGQGNESAAAKAYIFQTTQWQAVNMLDDYVATFSGSPINDWAGPVSVALNAEYRQQSLVESTSANPLAPVTNVTGVLRNAPGPTGAPATTPLTAIYSYATVAPTNASNSVWEVSAETVVPLAKNLPLAKSLDVSGAVRYTDYSSSGSVETWKVGLDYQPVNDVRIRATESRDIRAPTLYDLYQGPSTIAQALTDPVSKLGGGVTINTQGNPNLAPEVALTTTAGVVYSPSWLPRFRMSVDYYNIKLDNAITTLGGNNPTLLAQCAAAPAAPLCAQLIVRGNGPANYPTQVFSEPFNIAKTWTDGVDVEASYNTLLADIYRPLPGNVNLRLLYSYQPTLDTQLFSGAPVTKAAGVVGLASSRVTLFLTYVLGPVTVDWQTRYYSPTNRTGTPGQYFADPGLGAYTLSDLNLTYRFKVEGHPTSAFLNVQNLFNAPPQIAPSVQLSGIAGLGNPVVPGQDGIGRYFTAGLRFQW